MDSNGQELRLALLIDGENVLTCYAEEVVSKATSLGSVKYRLAFGRFRAHGVPSWDSDSVRELGIQPVYVKSRIRRKNAADRRMIGWARAMVARGLFDGICIVSNDGDFAALAREVRAAGLHCFGIGTNDASKRLVASCDEFFRVGSDEEDEAI